MSAGVALGALIGIVTGAVFIILLRTLLRGSPSVPTVLTLLGQVLAIPAFWFGGTWFSTSPMLQSLQIENILLDYLVSLVMVFGAISSLALLATVWRVSRDIWKGD
jgi:hypothetical protein